MIRRTASEVLHDLETRIARLEGKTAAGLTTAYFFGPKPLLEEFKAFAEADFARQGLSPAYYHTWFKADGTLCIETPYGRKGVGNDMPSLLNKGRFVWDWKNLKLGFFFILGRK